MHKFFSVSLTAGILLSACQSKQAKVKHLQSEYQRAYERYYGDCIAPVFGGKGSADPYFKDTKPKTATQEQETAQRRRCEQEGKRVDDLQRELDLVAR
jgi:hypothetical protein